MIELTDEQISVLRQGSSVSVYVPQLGGDIVVILAGSKEESPTPPTSAHNDASSVPNGAQHLAEADRIALADGTIDLRVLRKIANRDSRPATTRSKSGQHWMPWC